MNLVFDLETNGLYHDCTEIHCLCIYDLDANQTLVYNDQGSEEPITRGLQILEGASTIIGHNIIGYDLTIINKLYPWFSRDGVTVDTLVCSRLLFPDLVTRDQRVKGLPMKLRGRHSLEAWGYRLGTNKGEFGKETDWKSWSQEMQDYCVTDVKVTTKLWSLLQPLVTGSN